MASRRRKKVIVEEDVEEMDIDEGEVVPPKKAKRAPAKKTKVVAPKQNQRRRAKKVVEDEASEEEEEEEEEEVPTQERDDFADDDKENKHEEEEETSIAAKQKESTTASKQRQKRTSNASKSNTKTVDVVEKEDDSEDTNEDEAAEARPKASTDIPAMPALLREEAPPAPTDNRRLMITKITMENFKSYAGVQEVGPFHKCFTAVVGPNGSGKSNVIDAMLFVFGYRAKMIRQNKLTELIHHSDAFSDVSSLRVTVHFQEIIDHEGDRNGFDVIENSAFSISRTVEAEKKGSSAYYINNTLSSWTEVRDLLKGRGIDLDNNRFLILQGEVEQIALMKPKGGSGGSSGLLEYLEDIIGSGRFVPLIEAASTRLDEANGERAERLNRLKAVEKEREGLEGALHEALEYIAKERELLSKRSVLYQLHRTEAEAKLHKAIAKRDEVAARLDGERAQTRDKVERLAELEAEYNRETKEYELLTREMAKAKADFAVHERQDVKFREDLKHLKNKRKKLAATIDKEKHALAAKKAEAKAHRDDLVRFAEEKQQLSAALKSAEAELEAMYASLKDATADLQAEMEAKQTALVPLSKKVNEGQSRLDVAFSERDMLARDIEAAKRAVDEARTKEGTLRQSIGELKNALSAVESRVSETRRRHASLVAEIEALTRREAEISDELRRVRTTVEERRGAAEAERSRGKVLEGVLRAKRAKSIEGIHDRLGDLGTIDSKYDVAISTACRLLDYIVVDNADVANRCIEYLKTHQLGQGFFLLLDQQEKFRSAISRKIDTPEGVPRLFDLVKVKDPRYLTAFYYALQDTLVAHDLEQATRIAFGNSAAAAASPKDRGTARYRVVTLEGQLIDTSGTMSGGGREVFRGGMRSSADAVATSDSANGGERIAELEKRHERLSEELRTCREARVARERELEGCVSTLEAAEREAERIRTDITGSTKQCNELVESVLPQLEKARDKTASAAALRRLAELDAAVQAAQREVDTAKKRAGEVEAEIAAIQQRIMEAGGLKLKMCKTRVDDLNRRLDELDKAATKGEVASTSGDKAAKKMAKQIAELERELADVDTAIEKHHDEYAGLEARAKDVVASFKQTQQLHEAKQKALKKIRKAFEEVQQEVDEWRKVEVDLVAQLDDAQRAVDEAQAATESWSKKIADVSKKWAKMQTDYDVNGDEPAAADSTKSTADGSQQPKQPKKTAGAKKKQKGNSKKTSSRKRKAAAADDSEEERLEAEEQVEEDEDEDQAELEKAAEESSEHSAGLPVLTREELSAVHKNELVTAIGVLEEELSRMKPNMAAITEYRKKDRDYKARLDELNAVTERRDALRRTYDDLRKQRLDEFMAGFTQITTKLKEMYQMITIGGDAELELVNNLDPFSEGVVFSVRPPKKSWKNISNLSGGEKTLSSLALVFALHHYKPSPLYVMDEIDAALDFKNVSIVAHYIRERTKNAQFVIISLRNNMFELSDRLIGIYKTQDCTKSVTINPHAFRV